MANIVTTFLSARRSYEYRADEIKLSLLCIRGVVDLIKSSFGFELGEIMTPPATFGLVANTNPPGLVFGLGVTPFPEGQGTAIRSITVDSRRIVFDVAGPSSMIAPTFSRFREQLAELKTAEGAPAVPVPDHFREYSELVAHVPGLLPRIFNQPVQQVIADTVGISEGDPSRIASSARFRPLPLSEEYPGSSELDVSSFRLDMRAGTKIEDGMVFSGAPLDTDAHLSLIDRLSRAVDLSRLAEL